MYFNINIIILVIMFVADSVVSRFYRTNRVISQHFSSRSCAKIGQLNNF